MIPLETPHRNRNAISESNRPFSPLFALPSGAPGYILPAASIRAVFTMKSKSLRHTVACSKRRPGRTRIQATERVPITLEGVFPWFCRLRQLSFGQLEGPEFRPAFLVRWSRLDPVLVRRVALRVEIRSCRQWTHPRWSGGQRAGPESVRLTGRRFRLHAGVSQRRIEVGLSKPPVRPGHCRLLMMNVGIPSK
jgi:hypothetical protein